MESDQDRSEQITEPSGQAKQKFWTRFGRGVRPPIPSEHVEEPTPKTGVGRLLREAREARRVSLEEVEHVTRIRSKYLAALEAGAYQELPTPGHVYGFLRTYALYLGLDWPEVEALYRKENPVRHFDPGIFHPQDIALFPRRPLVRAQIVLTLVVIVVVLVIGGWIYWQYGRPLLNRWTTPTPTKTPTTAAGLNPLATNTPSATSTRAVTVLPTSTPTAGVDTPTPLPPTATLAPTATPVVKAADATATLTPTPAPTATSSPTAVAPGKVVLSIKVIERAWIQVTVDGQEQPGKIFEAGDEQTWEARQTIYFICGNAGGVQVTVNGEDLGVLGERAQVIEKVWTPLGEATPTPVPEATATPVPTPTPQG